MLLINWFIPTPTKKITILILHIKFYLVNADKAPRIRAVC